MPISSRDDHLLRLIQQMGAVLARMLGLKNGGQVREALQALGDAQGELLGPLAGVLPRMDSATAAILLGDPTRIAAWARVVHERAGLLRLRGDPADADAEERRANELAREALGRADGFESAVRELLGPLADVPG